MINVPKQYIDPLIQLIEWHKSAYMPERSFDIQLNRILEKLYKESHSDDIINLEFTDLFFIDECVSNATNNFDEHKINKDLVWEMYDWIRAERKTY